MLRPTRRCSKKQKIKEIEVEKAVRKLEKKTKLKFYERMELEAKSELVESSVVSYLKIYLQSLSKELIRSSVKGQVSVHTINETIKGITG